MSGDRETAVGYARALTMAARDDLERACIALNDAGLSEASIWLHRCVDPLDLWLAPDGPFDQLSTPEGMRNG
ncbi:MAG: hypothetical protein AAF965_09420 [Pseudomonadota bacterium]